MIPWIKVEMTTPDKIEVLSMARLLKIRDWDAVVGKLIRLWVWADLHTIDGNHVQCTEAFIDRLTYCKGFAKALRAVGWLQGEDGDLMFTNFDRHNGETSKARMAVNRRVESWRSKHRGDQANKWLPRNEKGEGKGVTFSANKTATCNDGSVTDVADVPLPFPLHKPLPEKEDRSKKERGREIQQCMEQTRLPCSPSSPPFFADECRDAGERCRKGGEEFVNWVKSVRPGWDAGKFSYREREMARQAFEALQRPLSELEREACVAYLAHQPPNGNKYDYPPDRELFLKMFHEVLQKAVLWFRRTGRKTRSEVEESHRRKQWKEEDKRMQCRSLTSEERIEQINGLRVTLGTPLLTEEEEEKIRNGEAIHET